MTDVPPLLTKCCSKCGEWKPLGSYYADRCAKSGYHSSCKSCVKARQKQDYDDPEKRAKILARKRAYRKDPDKAAVEYARKRRWKEKPENRLRELIYQRKNRARKEYREAQKRYIRINHMNYSIALETCKRLGIDLTKLAKERRASVEYHTRIGAMRYAIAIETCKRLGIDTRKLAKEQYDAEQREKHARTENLQQGERTATRDPEAAHGRSGNQAGRRRTRSAGVVPAAGE